MAIFLPRLPWSTTVATVAEIDLKIEQHWSKYSVSERDYVVTKASETSYWFASPLLASHGGENSFFLVEGGISTTLRHISD